MPQKSGRNLHPKSDKMVQGLYKFLFLLLLVLANRPVEAQQKPLTVIPQPFIFAKYFVDQAPIPPANVPAFYLPALLALPANAGIAPDYYTRHFGFFCRKELQFEKVTAIPLRFRLGTLDYVNKLEGK